MSNPRCASVKRGDSFTLACVYKEDGIATSLAPYTLRAQVRTPSMTLVEELIVAVADQAAKPGHFELSAANPVQWPMNLLLCDIRLQDAQGVVRTSISFEIPVEQNITH